MVKNGQIVSTNEVIASIEIPGKHKDLDIAQALGLDPMEAARLILCKQGDTVRIGDVIARKRGLFPKLVYSPVNGKVADCSNARVLIEMGSNPLVVYSGFTGVVKEVIPDYGAILVTEGAVIQGVWGNGRLAEGLMICLARSPVEELNPERMDVGLRGSVVFGGSCLKADTLRFTSEIPLRGLVVSSIAPELLGMAESLPFPVIALIGLGKIPYDDHTYQMIINIDKRVACVNATAWDRCSGSRPEVVIPKRGEGPVAELPEEVEYRTDQLVRILQSPYLWETARIKTILPDARLLPSGITAVSALCVMDNGEETVQPLTNLEVIL